MLGGHRPRLLIMKDLHPCKALKKSSEFRLEFAVEPPYPSPHYNQLFDSCETVRFCIMIEKILTREVVGEYTVNIRYNELLKELKHARANFASRDPTKNEKDFVPGWILAACNKVLWNRAK